MRREAGAFSSCRRYFVIVTAYNSRDEIDVLIGNINRLLSRYGSIEYKLVFGVYFADEVDKTAPVRILMDRVALARESVKGSALKMWAITPKIRKMCLTSVGR